MIVSLTGIARFRVQQELQVLTPYRRVEADYRAYGSDLIADVSALDVNRDGLVDVLRAISKPTVCRPIGKRSTIRR